MTGDRNGEPSGSPERLIRVKCTLLAEGRKASPPHDFRCLSEWVRLSPHTGAKAYVCEFSNPPGWGVCFVRPDGDFFKYYPDQETAEVAAMMGV